QRLGRLCGRPSQNVAEEQDRPPPRWKPLQSDDERQPQVLAPLRLLFGGGKRLQPRQDRGLAPFSLGERIQTDPGGDAVDPCPRCRASLKGPATIPGAQESLLDRVLCVGQRSQHSVAVRQDVAAEPLQLRVKIRVL